MERNWFESLQAAEAEAAQDSKDGGSGPNQSVEGRRQFDLDGVAQALQGGDGFAHHAPKVLGERQQLLAELGNMLRLVYTSGDRVRAFESLSWPLEWPAMECTSKSVALENPKYARKKASWLVLKYEQVLCRVRHRSRANTSVRHLWAPLFLVPTVCCARPRWGASFSLSRAS